MTDHSTNHDTDHAVADNGKPRYDDINTPVVILVGVLSAIVTIAIIAGVQGLCYQWANWEMERKAVNLPAKQQIAEQRLVLDGTETSISIDDAMDKVITEFGSH